MKAIVHLRLWYMGLKNESKEPDSSSRNRNRVRWRQDNKIYLLLCLDREDEVEIYLLLCLNNGNDSVFWEKGGAELVIERGGAHIRVHITRKGLLFEVLEALHVSHSKTQSTLVSTSGERRALVNSGSSEGEQIGMVWGWEWGPARIFY